MNQVIGAKEQRDGVDRHSLVFHAKSQLSCIRQMALSLDDRTIDYLTGWQLYCLLEPIEKALSNALQLDGGDPDLKRTSTE